jgi:hypothetical protein
MTGARRVRGLVAAAVVAVAVADAGAQERLALTAMPVYQAWTFADAIAQDSSTVSRVTQMAVPVGLSIPLGTRWALDVAAAYVRGTVEREGGTTLPLDGPSDVRVRLVGRLVGDHLLLTAGATLPTGKTGLAGDELKAQRLIGAPILRLPVPALGTGFGATAGLVVARRAGPWALALGTSYELRGAYQPVESAIAGAGASTDLDPGDAIHLSVGADRLVGQHRLALMVVGDIYGDDEISLGSAAGPQTSSYRLGPTLRGLLQLDVAARGFRELSLYGQVRHRAAFTGIDGATVEGSSGTVFDAGFSSIIGRPRALGVIVRADVMIDSGLEVDNSLATAGGTVGGATLGLSIPMGRGALEPFVRWQMGRIDTGPASTSATALTAGVSLGVR